MGYACSILTDGHKVVAHVQNELVYADTLGLIILVHIRSILCFCSSSIELNLLVIVFLMDIGHRRLVYVKQDIDIFPRIWLVTGLIRLWKCLKSLTGDFVFRVFLVDILVIVGP